MYSTYKLHLANTNTTSISLATPQISELKPTTAYVFLVRAENSHGISMPSGLSTVVKTLGAENEIVPQSELAAARAVLSGKVIID